MENKIPTFEFLIDDSEDSGVKTLSVVTSPAMESSFITLDKQDKKSKYVFIDKDEKQYKGIVAGLAIIPDKMIFRQDEEGNDYQGFFSIETIEKIRNKYHKEVMNLKSVNIEHSDVFIDAFLIESYILDTEERVNEVKSKGIEEATLGSWFTAFKIENKEVFNACVSGVFNGFSVEAFLDRELKLSVNNNNFKKIKTMKKNLLERLKMRVNKILDEVNFEESLVPELNVTLVWDEVGSDVTKTYVNDDELEVTEPIGVGEFVVEDGRIIVVDENSMLVEVRDAVVEEELVEEEVVIVEPEVSGDTVVEEELVEEVVIENDIAAATLGELIDVTKDGSYSISVVVLDGVITEANVSAEQNLIAQELNDKIKELELKLSEPIAEPKLTDKKVIDGEVLELTVYEKIAKRKGIQTV